MNLLTSRWSPTSRVGSMEPDGILKAWTTKVRMRNARAREMTMASAYSLQTDLALPDATWLFLRRSQLVQLFLEGLGEHDVPFPAPFEDLAGVGEEAPSDLVLDHLDDLEPLDQALLDPEADVVLVAQEVHAVPVLHAVHDDVGQVVDL